MTTDTDLIKLYSARILALAAEMPAAQRLEDPDLSAKRRSPLCGSTVTVDLGVSGETVIRYGQDVKACALGQAAASVVGSAIVGCSRAQIEQARDELKAMLKSDGPVPTAPFEGLEVLIPARDYKNRHSSIMLALDAACDAFAAQDNRQNA